MLKEEAKVINASQNKATVKVTRQKMCSCCPISEFCLSTEQTLTIDNVNLKLAEGDKVEIGIEDKKNFLAGLFAFLAPCFIFVTILIVFKKSGELNSFFLAILAIIVYYLILRVFLKKNNSYFNIKILKKINQTND